MTLNHTSSKKYSKLPTFPSDFVNLGMPSMLHSLMSNAVQE